MGEIKNSIWVSLSLALLLVGCSEEGSTTVKDKNEGAVVEEEKTSNNETSSPETVTEENKSDKATDASASEENAKVEITYDSEANLFHFNRVTSGTSAIAMNQLLGEPTLIEEETEAGEYFRYYYHFDTKYEESLLFYDYGGEYHITSMKYETTNSKINDVLSQDFFEQFDGDIYHFTGELFNDENTLNGWAFLNDKYFLQISELRDYENPEKIYYTYTMSELWELHTWEESYTLIDKETLKRDFAEYFFD